MERYYLIGVKTQPTKYAAELELSGLFKELIQVGRESDIDALLDLRIRFAESQFPENRTYISSVDRLLTHLQDKPDHVAS